jgi:hypothetical protein
MVGAMNMQCSSHSRLLAVSGYMQQLADQAYTHELVSNGNKNGKGESLGFGGSAVAEAKLTGWQGGAVDRCQ